MPYKVPALPRPVFTWIVWGFLLSGTSVFAEPEITGTSPGAVKPGEAIDLTIAGKNLAGATSLWTSFPAEVSLSPDVKDNGKQGDRVVFRVKATDPNVLGVHGVRVVTPGGISPLKLLVVDDLASLAQTNTNKTPDAAQPLSLPIAVDGRIDNLSLNYYRFSASAGQRISIEVLARRMGSALDPMIRLFKADGRELAYSDDAPGLLGDSRLCHTFEEAGDYILEVRDIRFQGGADHTYRLRVGDFPCINVPYPLGVQRSKEATLEFAGPDLEGVEPLKVNVPNLPDVNWLTVGAKRTGGNASGFATVSVGDREELLEAEPNNTPEQSQKTTLAANFNGRLQEPSDVDRFSFSAKKGQNYTFRAVTRSQGSPADLILKLYDAQGNKIAENDDAGSEDAVLKTTFGADGDFTLSVEDLHGRGGPEFAYRIEVQETEAGFALEAASDGINVPQGGVSMIQVIARRNDYPGPIAVRAEGLPEGVAVCPSVIGPNQNGVNLCLTSSESTQPGTLHNIKIIGEAEIGGQKISQTADLGLALKAKTNQMPYPPANLMNAMALGVSPPAPFSLRIEPAEVTFGKDLSATFKVIATRQKDYNEAITLAVPNINDGGQKPVPGLPGNMAAALKPIPANQNEIEITLTANDKAPEGDFTIVLDGSLKKGDATIKQPATALYAKLSPPLFVAIDAKPVVLKPDGKHKIEVSVVRNPALKGETEIMLKNLPAGVTAPPAKIPADKTSVAIEVTAAKDAKPASANNVTAEGKINFNNKAYTDASPPVTVTIESP